MTALEPRPAGAGQPAPDAQPKRSFRRTLYALLFLYGLAAAAATLAGVNCQGAAEWRPKTSEAPAPDDR